MLDFPEQSNVPDSNPEDTHIYGVHKSFYLGSHVHQIHPYALQA